MSSVQPRAASPVLRIVVWSAALGMAAVGVVLAVVSSSLWPLVAAAGLALPMMPFREPARPRSGRR